jgi:O-acetyl-ADP-ribose deacetylase (regulator of RNase III)
MKELLPKTILLDSIIYLGDFMSSFKLINDSSINQEVDAIVNAANNRLMNGSGVCGAIFTKAGPMELANACSKYQTPLKDGEVVITPSFNIKNAKHIIHAVGPDFGRTPTAFLELFNAYYNSLLCLMNNELHSISFPLISSGIFGGNLPDAVAESTKQCFKAYNVFLRKYPEYDINVLLCAFTDDEYIRANNELQKRTN